MVLVTMSLLLLINTCKILIDSLTVQNLDDLHTALEHRPAHTVAHTLGPLQLHLLLSRDGADRLSLCAAIQKVGDVRGLTLLEINLVLSYSYVNPKLQQRAFHNPVQIW